MRGHIRSMSAAVGLQGLEPAVFTSHTLPGPDRMKQTLKILDHGGFSKRLLFVGASGFLASIYCLFATNVTKPALFFVYPPCDRLSSNAGMVIDELMLIGAAIGMLVAGNLADLKGRKKLYGFELAALIIATLGVTQASEGFRSRGTDGKLEYTMDIYSWLAWWRFVLGCAIGAEHPLVTIITAEWVSRKSRGRMLASVYAAQPVARLLSYAVGIAALKIASSHVDPSNIESSMRVADQVWRWVTGIAIIPAALAVGFRFTVPESPRFHAYIRRDLSMALKKAGELYGTNALKGEPNGQSPGNPDSDSEGEGESLSLSSWWGGAVKCLRHTRAGKDLAVLSLLWAIVDISWYCLSMDSPGAMPTFWNSPSGDKNDPGEGDCPELNSWLTDTSNPGGSFHREMERNAVRFAVVVSIGAILGSAALIVIVNRFHRRSLLRVTSCALALLFGITGTVLLATPPKTDNRTAVDVLFGIMHFLFGVGPRTLVMIIAAEVFPTVYRGTFYGMAAAAGKVGAIVIRPIIGRTTKMEGAVGIRLLVAVILMALVASLCRFLPEVQREKKPRDHEQNIPASDGEKARAASGRPWFIRACGLRKLENMSLEEIAPNPQDRLGAE
ncbi:major facilitator superfamily domain-containing protein [Podospora australis]|uniref:Major facilitator superfamily domain-containing protein n=1 Tax=Podospora australis TaxID=1536484 RepID=A0AAN6WN13_9PEZI|nr:major facilitator superfamily domain-containing protein [Podospora australis]